MRLPTELPTAPSQLRSLVVRLATPSEQVNPRDSVRALISLYERLQDAALPINPSVVSLLGLRLAWQLRDIPYHDRARSSVLMTRSGASIFDVMRDEVSCNLHLYSPPQLVQVVRAFGVAGVRQDLLFRDIVKALQPHICEMTVMQRCHVAWSYATLDINARPLFRELVEATKRTLSLYAPENLATTMWAYARLGITDRAVYQMMLHAAKQSRGAFDAQALANIAWTQAETGVRDCEFLDVIANDLAPLVPEMSIKALPYVVWSYASLGVAAPQLFDAVVGRLSGRIGLLSPLGAAKFLWAISRAGIVDEDLLAETASHLYDSIGELYGGTLSSVAWAFGNIGYRDDRLFGALAERLADNMGTINPSMLVNAIWAFGHVGFRHEGLFREFCGVLEVEKNNLPAKVYATAVWSIAAVHPEMLKGLVERSDLDRLGYDPSGWIQVYNALLIAGVISPVDTFPAYEKMKQRLMVGAPNSFELDVERTIRDILADSSYTIEPQKIIGGVVTDWYVEVNGKKFAIECDGKRHHVLLGPDGGVAEGGERWVAPARDYAQDKVLRLFGVTPIHVLSSTFYACKGDVPTLVSSLRAES